MTAIREGPHEPEACDCWWNRKNSMIGVSGIQIRFILREMYAQTDIY